MGIGLSYLVRQEKFSGSPVKKGRKNISTSGSQKMNITT
jgi:hypothetical protein